MKNEDIINSNVILTLMGDYFCSVNCDNDEFSKITDYLYQQKYPIINFEGSFSSGSLAKKAIRLESCPEKISVIDRCLLSLANNHTLDFGVTGLNNLIKALDMKSIKYFGINANSSVNDNFKVFNLDGLKVCLVGFGAKNEECVEPSFDRPGVLDFNSKNLKASIDSARPLDCDYLLVYAHIGYEFERYPLPLHVGLCSEAVDLGADLVYCSHTHCLQPYEIYRDKYIFYGLGNFYFSENRDRYPEISDIGAIVKLSLNKQKREVKVSEIDKITYSRPSPGLKIESFSEYIQQWKLNEGELEAYSRIYAKIRTRRKNPRPILYYGTPRLNAIKFIFWRGVVDLTGLLGIRKFIKWILRWQ